MLLRCAFGLSRIEATSLVGHLDHQPVRQELVRDLDDAGPIFAVGMADRVRRRLGQRELEVGEQLVGQGADTRDSRQGEPAQSDVFRPGRDREAYRGTVAVAVQSHRLVRRHSVRFTQQKQNETT